MNLTNQPISRLKKYEPANKMLKCYGFRIQFHCIAEIIKINIGMCHKNHLKWQRKQHVNPLVTVPHGNLHCEIEMKWQRCMDQKTLEIKNWKTRLYCWRSTNKLQTRGGGRCNNGTHSANDRNPIFPSMWHQHQCFFYHFTYLLMEIIS